VVMALLIKWERRVYEPIFSGLSTANAINSLTIASLFPNLSIKAIFNVLKSAIFLISCLFKFFILSPFVSPVLSAAGAAILLIALVIIYHA